MNYLQLKYLLKNPSGRVLSIVCFILLHLHCKKFVEVPAPTSDLTVSTVFTSDAKATAALTGIYSRIATSTGGYAPGGPLSFTVMAGLSADELVDYSNGPAGEFYANQISINNPSNLGIWRNTYQYIYQANSVLEGLITATGLTDGTKRQLEGEAKFLRAFFHFYLVNFWGDIPYIATTDYRINSIAVRNPVSNVYQNIIRDLLDAENLISENYVTTERVRPNKATVAALLSRVYLFSQDWANAETIATAIINNTVNYEIETDLNKVFQKGSREAIWQLMPVVPGLNSSEGYNFILTAIPSVVALSSQVVNGFESGDLRKTNWVGKYGIGPSYYYPYKYKIKTSPNITEYTVVFRLAEQYLIRAEARVHQNRLTGVNGAVEDINLIRNRAGLLPVNATTQAGLLAAIEQERASELFTEWGHRWMDLKRTNRADSVLKVLKGAGWHSSDILYPVPQLEILNDNRLIQNPGY